LDFIPLLSYVLLAGHRFDTRWGHAGKRDWSCLARAVARAFLGLRGSLGPFGRLGLGFGHVDSGFLHQRVDSDDGGKLSIRPSLRGHHLVAAAAGKDHFLARHVDNPGVGGDVPVRRHQHFGFRCYNLRSSFSFNGAIYVTFSVFSHEIPSVSVHLDANREPLHVFGRVLAAQGRQWFVVRTVSRLGSLISGKAGTSPVLTSLDIDSHEHEGPENESHPQKSGRNHFGQVDRLFGSRMDGMLVLRQPNSTLGLEVHGRGVGAGLLVTGQLRDSHYGRRG